MTSSQRAELNKAMVRLADGDRSVMGLVYQGLRPAVLRLCRRMAGDEATAEDLTQRALLRLFRETHRFDRAGDALAWALTLAYWECRSELRRRSRRKEAPLSLGLAELSPTDTGTADPWNKVELRQALELALGHLSGEDREVVQDAVLGQALSPAKRKRKQRALARMRAWWQKEMTHE